MSDKVQKNLEQNFCYQKDFKYTHDNPYHERLGAFDHFVLRDDQAEKNQGLWNKEIFKTEAPLMVEIGTGYGEFMIEYCHDHPDHNFIGLDHRFKRSFHLAKKLDKIEHKNFRYLRARGERMNFMFNPGEVDGIFYFFPDPWPKTRHFKKRLFQKPFLDAAAQILKKDGVVYIKTDHDGYYEWMLNELKDETRFKIELNTRNLRNEHPDHFLSKYITKFEKIFISQGVLIKAIVLRNIK